MGQMLMQQTKLFSSNFKNQFKCDDAAREASFVY